MVTVLPAKIAESEGNCEEWLTGPGMACARKLRTFASKCSCMGGVVPKVKLFVREVWGDLAEPQAAPVGTTVVALLHNGLSAQAETYCRSGLRKRVWRQTPCCVEAVRCCGTHCASIAPSSHQQRSYGFGGRRFNEVSLKLDGKHLCPP